VLIGPARYTPTADDFLSFPFTLHQLRKVHEAVVSAEL
jgi:hypothetical protein